VVLACALLSKKRNEGMAFAHFSAYCKAALYEQQTASPLFSPPTFLTAPTDARALIRKLLTVDATKRATMDEVRQDVWVNMDYDEPPPRYRPAQETVPASQGAPLDRQETVRANEGAPLDSQRPNGDGEQASEPVVAPEPGVKQADGSAEVPNVSPSISPNQQPEKAQPVAAEPTGEQGCEGGKERERSASVPDPPATAAALIGDPADAVPEADETVESDEAADHVGELAGAAVRVYIVASPPRISFYSQFCCSCYKMSGRLRAG
jgi:serine/threonine protein kinase